MPQSRLSTSKSASETANQTRKRSKLNFREPRARSSKFEVQNRAKHTNIRPKHSVLAAISSLATNALLRCEQRNAEAAAYHLKH